MGEMIWYSRVGTTEVTLSFAPFSHAAWGEELCLHLGSSNNFEAGLVK